MRAGGLGRCDQVARQRRVDAGHLTPGLVVHPVGIGTARSSRGRRSSHAIAPRTLVPAFPGLLRVEKLAALFGRELRQGRIGRHADCAGVGANDPGRVVFARRRPLPDGLSEREAAIGVRVEPEVLLRLPAGRVGRKMREAAIGAIGTVGRGPLSHGDVAGVVVPPRTCATLAAFGRRARAVTARAVAHVRPPGRAGAVAAMEGCWRQAIAPGIRQAGELAVGRQHAFLDAGCDEPLSVESGSAAQAGGVEGRGMDPIRDHAGGALQRAGQVQDRALERADHDAVERVVLAVAAAAGAHLAIIGLRHAECGRHGCWGAKDDRPGVGRGATGPRDRCRNRVRNDGRQSLAVGQGMDAFRHKPRHVQDDPLGMRLVVLRLSVDGVDGRGAGILDRVIFMLVEPRGRALDRVEDFAEIVGGVAQAVEHGGSNGSLEILPGRLEARDGLVELLGRRDRLRRDLVDVARRLAIRFGEAAHALRHELSHVLVAERLAGPVSLDLGRVCRALAGPPLRFRDGVQPLEDVLVGRGGFLLTDLFRQA